MTPARQPATAAGRALLNRIAGSTNWRLSELGMNIAAIEAEAAALGATKEREAIRADYALRMTFCESPSGEQATGQLCWRCLAFLRGFDARTPSPAGDVVPNAAVAGPVEVAP